MTAVGPKEASRPSVLEASLPRMPINVQPWEAGEYYHPHTPSMKDSAESILILKRKVDLSSSIRIVVARHRRSAAEVDPKLTTWPKWLYSSHEI